MPTAVRLRRRGRGISPFLNPESPLLPAHWRAPTTRAAAAAAAGAAAGAAARGAVRARRAHSSDTRHCGAADDDHSFVLLMLLLKRPSGLPLLPAQLPLPPPYVLFEESDHRHCCCMRRSCCCRCLLLLSLLRDFRVPSGPLLTIRPNRSSLTDTRQSMYVVSGRDLRDTGLPALY